MENVNCSNCKNMALDLFSGVHYCGVTHCGCHPEKSNFLLKVGETIPRWFPESTCPGMVALHVDTNK